MPVKKKRTIKPAKVKAARSRKKSKTSTILASLKYLFIWIVMAVLVFIGILFVYDYFYPPTKEDKSAVKQEQPVRPLSSAETKKPEGKNAVPSTDKPKTGNKKPVEPETNSLSFPAEAEIPRLQTQRKEQVIRYTGHTVSYNVEYKVSNWVAWELTAQEAKSTENERSNKFVPDPSLKGQTAMNEDYSNTGYDKGHMLPAGDVKWSAKAMRESFYYSNICPQLPALNRGAWKELEEQCRLWAKEHGSLMIVTGPVLEDNLKRLGKNRIAIPKRFYKVILTISDNKYQGIAFLMENKDYKNTSLKLLAISIDSVETVTGIDFFPNLPDKQENEMEASVNWSCWSF